MRQIRDYRDNAEECRAVASDMKNERLRAQVLELARQWDGLADDREKIVAMQASLRDVSELIPKVKPSPYPEESEPRLTGAGNGSAKPLYDA